MTTATHRWVALLLLALAAPAALAQTLGDEFILFVDGTNVMVPGIEGGVTVADPLDATNTVMRYSAGAWAESGFAWPRATGIDATANVGATSGEGDTLYFRLLSDPANATAGFVSILLSDATDDSGASRADVEAGTATADYLMRLVWNIPAELHDGLWHDLAIPLPPTTWEALETARTNGELMDGAENWQYTGAWSSGGFGIGGVGGFAPPTDDPLWQEFSWDNLYRIGPFWDNSAGGGPVYMDDVYIGGPDTDISGATQPPVAMSGATFSANGESNLISWSEVPDTGGYNVYASLNPITDVTAPGVTLLRRVLFSDPTELVHQFENPHPSLGAPTVYYAVTTLSQFGVENKDVSSSAGVVTNSGLAQSSFIRQLTEDEANNLFDDVANGTVSDASFPADHPVFVFDSNHRTVTEGGFTPTDEDLSARVKIGYSDLNEWFIYGEITDDIAVFAPEGETGGNTYLYDSIELEIGHYDVRMATASDALNGSAHTGMQRGAEPDYQIRIAGKQDVSGNPIGSSTWIGFSRNEDFDGATIAEKTATGWRFLTLLPMDQIQAAGDALLAVPGPDELQLIAFSMSLNDADATGQRESQIVFSVKPNVTNQWYQTPAQWEVYAVAGRDLVATAVEDGTEVDGFSLAQTVPNPASGTTQIGFTLGSARQVQIEVFNTLGQRVAVVADGARAAGDHTVTLDTRGLAAGVYVYRLSAGDYVATRRMTVVR